jgi:hypothetical protein
LQPLHRGGPRLHDDGSRALFAWLQCDRHRRYGGG